MLIATMISQIRRALGYPHEAILGDDMVLLELWEVVGLYRAKLKLTGEAWLIKRTNFKVPAGTTTEGLITVGDFATPYLIQTIDPTNPYHIRRTVDIVRLDQLEMFYHGPDTLQMGGTWYAPHVARAMAPFNENGARKMKWAPAHLQAATYEIWYSPSAINDVPPIFDDTSQMPIEEQNFLVIAECAINLFPEVIDPEKGPNAKQSGLLQVQTKKMQQWNEVFENQKWDFRREPSMRRKIFGQRRGQ